MAPFFFQPKDWLATMTVLQARVPMLMTAALYPPSVSDQKELTRMVTEKMTAQLVGMAAAQHYWWSLGVSMATGSYRAPTGAWGTGADPLSETLNLWMAPGRHTLQQNARRLAARREGA